jgi:hypothetical protein
MPKYAMRGVPDIILVRDGLSFFLEVKRLIRTESSMILGTALAVGVVRL